MASAKARVDAAPWKGVRGQKRVLREFKYLCNQIDSGREKQVSDLQLVGDNVNKWRFKLKNFDDDVPGGRQLNRDLAQLFQCHGQDFILMEIKFPAEYPSEPFFLRVVSPRCQWYTGHVTAGGSICIEALTLSSSPGAWHPDYCVDSILRVVISNMVDAEIYHVQTATGPGGLSGPLRIDLHGKFHNNVLSEYGEHEAVSAFHRMQAHHGRNGWGPQGTGRADAQAAPSGSGLQAGSRHLTRPGSKRAAGLKFGPMAGPGFASGSGQPLGLGFELWSSPWSGLGSALGSALESGFGSVLGAPLGSMLGSGLGSGLGSALGSGLGSGLESALGSGPGSARGPRPESALGSGPGTTKDGVSGASARLCPLVSTTAAARASSPSAPASSTGGAGMATANPFAAKASKSGQGPSLNSTQWLQLAVPPSGKPAGLISSSPGGTTQGAPICLSPGTHADRTVVTIGDTTGAGSAADGKTEGKASATLGAATTSVPAGMPSGPTPSTRTDARAKWRARLAKDLRTDPTYAPGLGKHPGAGPDLGDGIATQRQRITQRSGTPVDLTAPAVMGSVTQASPGHIDAAFNSMSGGGGGKNGGHDADTGVYGSRVDAVDLVFKNRIKGFGITNTTIGVATITNGTGCPTTGIAIATNSVAAASAAIGTIVNAAATNATAAAAIANTTIAAVAGAETAETATIGGSDVSAGAPDAATSGHVANKVASDTALGSGIVDGMKTVGGAVDAGDQEAGRGGCILNVAGHEGNRNGLDASLTGGNSDVDGRLVTLDRLTGSGGGGMGDTSRLAGSQDGRMTNSCGLTVGQTGGMARIGGYQVNISGFTTSQGCRVNNHVVDNHVVNNGMVNTDGRPGKSGGGGASNVGIDQDGSDDDSDAESLPLSSLNVTVTRTGVKRSGSEEAFLSRHGHAGAFTSSHPGVPRYAPVLRASPPHGPATAVPSTGSARPSGGRHLASGLTPALLTTGVSSALFAPFPTRWPNIQSNSAVTIKHASATNIQRSSAANASPKTAANVSGKHVTFLTSYDPTRPDSSRRMPVQKDLSRLCMQRQSLPKQDPSPMDLSTLMAPYFKDKGKETPSQSVISSVRTKHRKDDVLLRMLDSRASTMKQPRAHSAKRGMSCGLLNDNDGMLADDDKWLDDDDKWLASFLLSGPEDATGPVDKSRQAPKGKAAANSSLQASAGPPAQCAQLSAAAPLGLGLALPKREDDGKDSLPGHAKDTTPIGTGSLQAAAAADDQTDAGDNNLLDSNIKPLAAMKPPTAGKVGSFRDGLRDGQARAGAGKPAASGSKSIGAVAAGAGAADGAGKSAATGSKSIGAVATCADARTADCPGDQPLAGGTNAESISAGGITPHIGDSTTSGIAMGGSNTGTSNAGGSTVCTDKAGGSAVGVNHSGGSAVGINHTGGSAVGAKNTGGSVVGARNTGSSGFGGSKAAGKVSEPTATNPVAGNGKGHDKPARPAATGKQLVLPPGAAIDALTNGAVDMAVDLVGPEPYDSTAQRSPAGRCCKRPRSTATVSVPPDDVILLSDSDDDKDSSGHRKRGWKGKAAQPCKPANRNTSAGSPVNRVRAAANTRAVEVWPASNQAGSAAEQGASAEAGLLTKDDALPALKTNSDCGPEARTRAAAGLLADVVPSSQGDAGTGASTGLGAVALARNRAGNKAGRQATWTGSNSQDDVVICGEKEVLDLADGVVLVEDRPSRREQGNTANNAAQRAPRSAGGAGPSVVLERPSRKRSISLSDANAVGGGGDVDVLDVGNDVLITPSRKKHIGRNAAAAAGAVAVSKVGSVGPSSALDEVEDLTDQVNFGSQPVEYDCTASKRAGNHCTAKINGAAGRAGAPLMALDGLEGSTQRPVLGGGARQSAVAASAAAGPFGLLGMDDDFEIVEMLVPSEVTAPSRPQAPSSAAVGPAAAPLAGKSLASDEALAARLAHEEELEASKRKQEELAKQVEELQRQLKEKSKAVPEAPPPDYWDQTTGNTQKPIKLVLLPMPGSKPQVSCEQVEELVFNGFTQDQAVEALLATNHDTNAATMYGIEQFFFGTGPSSKKAKSPDVSAALAAEVEKVLTRFGETGAGVAKRSRVKAVVRVQNRRLWTKFVMREREVAELLAGTTHNANVRLLFHGTDRKNMVSILQGGFDIRVSNMGGALGAGTYFAEDSSYSHTYSTKGSSHGASARMASMLAAQLGSAAASSFPAPQPPVLPLSFSPLPPSLFPSFFPPPGSTPPLPSPNPISLALSTLPVPFFPAPAPTPALASLVAPSPSPTNPLTRSKAARQKTARLAAGSPKAETSSTATSGRRRSQPAFPALRLGWASRSSAGPSTSVPASADTGNGTAEDGASGSGVTMIHGTGVTSLDHRGWPGRYSMMLCRVVLGRVGAGGPNLRKPPEGFDSVSNVGTVGPHSIYAVYDNAQAYPEYVVHYD